VQLVLHVPVAEEHAPVFRERDNRSCDGLIAWGLRPGERGTGTENARVDLDARELPAMASPFADCTY
jgi:hypothetical protein